MASTGQALNAVAAEAEPQPPIQPHVTLAPAEMDKQYPPMNAPPHDELDDIMVDADDPVLQTGLRLADNIRQCTSLQGRLRRFKEDVNETNGPNTENVANICIIDKKRKHGFNDYNCDSARQRRPGTTPEGGRPRWRPRPSPLRWPRQEKHGCYNLGRVERHNWER